jgi:polygalacturonase
MRCPSVLSLFAAALVLLAVSAQAAPSANGVFDVRAFGATGGGTISDTAAVNAAITAAAAAGGGEVRFPAGTYLCRSIHLASNVTLYLGDGATIVAASAGDAQDAYDAPEPNPAAGEYEDYGHRHWHNSLIWGENLHDIGIIGQGRIYGRDLSHSDNGPDGLGNKSIALKLCRNVTLSGFTIQHGGWFGILATGVDNLTIDRLTIDTNRDGMDIDCCRHVHITDCTVNSPNDDGICLKSSYGLGFLRPTEDVTITGCAVSGYDEGTVLDGTYQHTNHNQMGRIKFGTEANGGFQNIAISNCTFAHCWGLALEEVDGGSLEDVSISNITMRDIVSAPIYIRLGSRLRGPKGTKVGDVDRISISHVIADNASAKSCVIISGIPGFPIQNITLSDIELWYEGGGTAAQAARVVPEQADGYPEPSSFGTMPAYGFFLRHVAGITLRDIQLHTLTPDGRPPFVLDDVAGLTVSNSAGLPDQQGATVAHSTP